MKFKFFSLFILGLALFACKDQTEKSQHKTEKTSPVTKEPTNSLAPPKRTFTPTIECYLYIKNNDTVILKLRQTKDSISGNLAYLWAEKDQNTGTISGNLKGDTIFADYKFTSEGKQSLRELVFLKKDDQLIEGFAPVSQENGKTIFENNEFDFDSELVLSRTDCRN